MLDSTSRGFSVPEKPNHGAEPQLELFERRLPKRPYCTNNLDHGLVIRGKRQAAGQRYIQVNPPWLRSFIVMDVDRPGAALAWEDALLPMPFWSSMNPRNGHAHLAWAIDAPVLLGQHDRQKPMRYLAAIEAGMREKLDADPGYSGLITKNPVHRHWRNAWAPIGRGVYDLDYLADHLNLPRHAPKSRPETVGLGRNCDTFDHLRYYAYREVRLWRDTPLPPPGHDERRGVYIHWLNHLYSTALDRTHNEHPIPLDSREVHWISRSVAGWVWTRFDVEASDRRWSARQAARGRRGGIRSGQVRREQSKDKRAAARLMRAQGMTQAAIAAELGVRQQSVSKWTKDRNISRH